MENRDWMYDRWLPGGGGYNSEFVDGVQRFLEFAKSQKHFMDGDKIKCPCLKCKNGLFEDVDNVRVHLFRKGFVDSYYWWTAHGESPFANAPPLEELSSTSNPSDMNLFGIEMHLFDNLNPTQRMVFDAAGPSFVPPPWFDTGTSYNELSSSPLEVGESHDLEEGSYLEESATVFGPGNEEMSLLSERFADVLRAADRPLYDGSHMS